MLSRGLIPLVLWCLVAHYALAQQFPTMKMSYETLNLSGPCFETLNTTVECSDRLAKHVAVDLLDQQGLTDVCDDTCRQSLVDLRTKILGSCDAKADTIQYSYLSFPATYIVDRYLYFYDVSCYRDGSTGKFCDTMVAGWRNEIGGSEAHFCDDCWLGPMSVQLQSPIGFNEDRAEEFASLTRSCSVDTYTTPTPTPYGETTATLTATLGNVTTTVQVSTNGTAMSTSTATEVTSAEDMMPSIYPLLEVGTAASADTTDGKEKTRRQRKTRPKNALKQRTVLQVNPRAPGTSKDCLKYQNFLPFELIYSKAYRAQEDLDDFGINGCRHTATKHGVSLKSFLAWNPSLTKMKDCKLQRGYSYCVKRPFSLPKAQTTAPVASNATMANSTATGVNLTFTSSQEIKRVKLRHE
ncbi:hypothetical protein LZ30DRAFT_775139 [Colletotrichum cereale]|nr:hypothetical protein LZ30DRAFT_775139 [Colletotrichum cereale]